MRYRVEGTKRTFGDDVVRGSDAQLLEADSPEAAAEQFLERNGSGTITYWTVDHVEEAAY
jgi:hypothetical protein